MTMKFFEGGESKRTFSCLPATRTCPGKNNNGKWNGQNGYMSRNWPLPEWCRYVCEKGFGCECFLGMEFQKPFLEHPRTVDQGLINIKLPHKFPSLHDESPGSSKMCFFIFPNITKRLSEGFHLFRLGCCFSFEITFSKNF